MNVMEYWLAKRQMWPELAEFALDILTRPVTSAATERHFSRTARIEGLRRLRLLPEHLDEIALIAANKAIAEQIIRRS